MTPTQCKYEHQGANQEWHGVGVYAVLMHLNAFTKFTALTNGCRNQRWDEVTEDYMWAQLGLERCHRDWMDCKIQL